MTRHVALALLFVPAAALATDPPLRLNQIQVIGTHNSYHIAPTKELLVTLAGVRKETAESLDYTHRPLPEQLGTLGIRQVELDVFADPKGGLYAKPSSRAALLGQKKDAGPDPNKDGILDKPGFKVLHAQDLDYLSTVPTLDGGLTQIRDWSKKHPTHLPICVMLELKDETIPLLATQPVKFDAKQLNAVDDAIRAVFDRTHLFTPDDLRGDADSLPKAIATTGWPKLDDVRGKVLFALDNEGELRNEYLDGHPALKRRVMFVGAVDEKHAAAAWFKVNDPIAQGDRIRKLVKAGFLVRTRADADTKEARTNDTKRRDAALASGAQFVSTDYPEPREEWSKYRVTLPDGGVARVNPISGDGRKAPAEWEPKR